MKKNYELVEVKVISLDNEDVITTSQTLNGTFNLGDLGHQDF